MRQKVDILPTVYSFKKLALFTIGDLPEFSHSPNRAWNVPKPLPTLDSVSALRNDDILRQKTVLEIGPNLFDCNCCSRR